MTRSLRCCLVLFALSLAASFAGAQEAGASAVRSFRVHFDEDAFGAAFDGDLLIAFSKEGEPREQMQRWFGAPPTMRFSVHGVAPGAALLLDQEDSVANYPVDWGDVEAGAWTMQAVARVSRTGRQAGLDAGDVYSDVVVANYDPSADGIVELTLSHVVPERVFQETERLRLFPFVSPVLSRFYGFEYTIKAGVLLPRDFDPEKSYPVLYSITGFGGTYESIGRWEARVQEGSPLEQCIIVVPDASNRYGHSEFCDSASIGPWGEALVHELIPALEAKFGGAGATQRYVTGVSSGGWSSLWLQVSYPNDFAGCWSHVPDPIDFHDFQGINLYEPNADGSPRNMFVDENGEPRPLARRDGKVMITYRDFTQHEHVLNPGGQIRSFEATFSPPIEDGTPQRVFDVETGIIDHAAAQAWRRYDISNLLLTRWDELRDSLVGKIHVYAGGEDTFYLEGAVERFMGLAKEAGILDEMTIKVIPGMPHQLYTEGFDAMVKAIGSTLG